MDCIRISGPRCFCGLSGRKGAIHGLHSALLPDKADPAKGTGLQFPPICMVCAMRHHRRTVSSRVSRTRLAPFQKPLRKNNIYNGCMPAKRKSYAVSISNCETPPGMAPCRTEVLSLKLRLIHNCLSYLFIVFKCMEFLSIQFSDVTMDKWALPKNRPSGRLTYCHFVKRHGGNGENERWPWYYGYKCIYLQDLWKSYFFLVNTKPICLVWRQIGHILFHGTILATHESHIWQYDFPLRLWWQEKNNFIFAYSIPIPYLHESFDWNVNSLVTVILIPDRIQVRM